MASISLQQLRVVEDQLLQIQEAIHNLELWNESLTDVNELLTSPAGMKTLAADCMIIEAIGEGIKRIDERTNQRLLPTRPEIPWKAVRACATVLHMVILTLTQTLFGMLSRMTFLLFAMPLTISSNISMRLYQ